jgi:hypothetical protein
MFPPREIETYEPFSIQDAFCDALVRVERLGQCRRLVFAVSDPHAPGGPARAVVAKLIVPSELMAELAKCSRPIAPSRAPRSLAFPSTLLRIERNRHEKRKNNVPARRPDAAFAGRSHLRRDRYACDALPRACDGLVCFVLFLRGFPAIQFPDFCLCVRLRV